MLFLAHINQNHLIRLIVHLNEKWSDRLGDLRITACNPSDQERPVTELVGKVRDQAELAGLLNGLYELHLTLLSVENLNGD